MAHCFLIFHALSFEIKLFFDSSFPLNQSYSKFSSMFFSVGVSFLL